MELRVAQNDMARAYAGGAPGVLVSGLVWLATGLVWSGGSVNRAFFVLFVGGVLIFPLSTAIARGLLRTPRTGPGNPLNRLAMESTFVLMAGILIGYVLLFRRPDLAIPAISVIMGARYFTFRTIYDQALYWVLAGVICTVGTLALLGRPIPLGNLALQVGAIEMVLSGVFFLQRPSSG